MNGWPTRPSAKVVASARTADEGESRLSGTLTETIARIEKAGTLVRPMMTAPAMQADSVNTNSL